MLSSYQKIPTAEIRSYANKLRDGYQQERNNIDSTEFPCRKRINENQGIKFPLTSASSSSDAPQTLYCGYRFEDNTSQPDIQPQLKLHQTTTTPNYS